MPLRSQLDGEPDAGHRTDATWGLRELEECRGGRRARGNVLYDQAKVRRCRAEQDERSDDERGALQCAVSQSRGLIHESYGLVIEPVFWPGRAGAQHPGG